MSSYTCPTVLNVTEEPQGTHCSWCWMGRAGRAFSGRAGERLVPCLPEQASISKVSLMEGKQKPHKKAEGH